MARKLSHISDVGDFQMVDVSRKPVTARVAVACGRVFMHRDTLALVREERARKGNVLAAAHLAGVMAAKRTATIIPLAHTLNPRPPVRVSPASRSNDSSPSL